MLWNAMSRNLNNIKIEKKENKEKRNIICKKLRTYVEGKNVWTCGTPGPANTQNLQWFKMERTNTLECDEIENHVTRCTNNMRKISMFPFFFCKFWKIVKEPILLTGSTITQSTTVSYPPIGAPEKQLGKYNTTKTIDANKRFIKEICNRNCNLGTLNHSSTQHGHFHFSLPQALMRVKMKQTWKRTLSSKSCLFVK